MRDTDCRNDVIQSNILGLLHMEGIIKHPCWPTWCFHGHAGTFSDSLLFFYFPYPLQSFSGLEFHWCSVCAWDLNFTNQHSFTFFWPSSSSLSMTQTTLPLTFIFLCVSVEFPCSQDKLAIVCFVFGFHPATLPGICTEEVQVQPHITHCDRTYTC